MFSTPHRSSSAGYALNTFMRYPTELVLLSFGQAIPERLAVLWFRLQINADLVTNLLATEMLGVGRFGDIGRRNEALASRP